MNNDDCDWTQYALDALLQIRALSDYPGKGRSSFKELADNRRRINKIACDVLNLCPTEAIP